MSLVNTGGLLIRRFMHLLALIAAAVTILDLSGLAPGLAPRLTPILLAGLILYLLHNDDHFKRIRASLRGQNRKLNALLPSSNRPRPSAKKSARPPQPEYRAIAWHGLTLRSQSEVKIAKVLDNRGILFLAAAKIRLSTESHRQTREVDFLILHQGRWGILEVDGPHHQHAQQADQWRDARFRDQGIAVSRFPADQCYRHPDQVVDSFLAALLQQPPTPAAPHVE